MKIYYAGNIRHPPQVVNINELKTPRLLSYHYLEKIGISAEALAEHYVPRERANLLYFEELARTHGGKVGFTFRKGFNLL